PSVLWPRPSRARAQSALVIALGVTLLGPSIGAQDSQQAAALEAQSSQETAVEAQSSQEAAAVEAQDSQHAAAVEQFIGTVIRQTAAACPLASPADQPALDRCRKALYGESALRRGLAPVMLWGRPSPEGRRLKDTNLTQFAPDVLTGLYIPLFMLTGEYD